MRKRIVDIGELGEGELEGDLLESDPLDSYPLEGDLLESDPLDAYLLESDPLDGYPLEALGDADELEAVGGDSERSSDFALGVLVGSLLGVGLGATGGALLATRYTVKPR